MWIYANQHPNDFFWLAFWVIVGATIVAHLPEARQSSRNPLHMENP